MYPPAVRRFWRCDHFFESILAQLIQVSQRQIPQGNQYVEVEILRKRSAGNRFRENRKQVHRSLRIVSGKGGSRMASKPELLHNQAADEIGQDFLFAYQRAVLLTLQRQGVLN